MVNTGVKAGSASVTSDVKPENKGEDVKCWSWRKLFLAIGCIAASVILAILFCYIGTCFMNTFNTSLWLTSIMVVVSEILAFKGISKIVDKIYPEKDEGIACGIVIFSIVLCSLVNFVAVDRKDNFDQTTGNSLVLLAQSTGKKYYDLKMKYDPETGEKLVSLTPELMKKIKEKAQKREVSSNSKRRQPSFKTVISRTFSEKDTNSEGWIRIISWSTDDVHIGDTICISGTSPNGDLSGFSYYNDLGKWAPISKSGKKIKVVFVPRGKKYLYICLKKGSKTLVKVNVKRRT